MNDWLIAKDKDTPLTYSAINIQYYKLSLIGLLLTIKCSFC